MENIYNFFKSISQYRTIILIITAIIAMIIAFIMIIWVVNLMLRAVEERNSPDNKETLKNLDYKSISKEKRAGIIRKIIAPDGVDPGPNGYMIIDNGGRQTFIRSFTISKMPKRTSFVSTFSPLFDFANCTSSVFVEPIDDYTMINKMDRHIIVLESEIQSANDINRVRKLNTQEKETEGWVSEVETGQNSFYNVGFVFSLYAPSFSVLNNLSDSFRALALSKSIEISNCFGCQAEAYLSNSPLCGQMNYESKYIKSDAIQYFQMDRFSVSTIYNYTQGNFSHHDGIPLGRNLYSGMPYIFDIFDPAHAGHTICIAGKTRAGKSALIKMMAARYLLLGYRFVAIDSQSIKGAGEGEFSPLARVSGGANYQFKANSRFIMNIYDINETTVFDRATGREYRTLQLSDKIVQVVHTYLTMIQGGAKLEDFSIITFASEILTEIVKEQYMACGLRDGDADSLYEEELSANDVLTSGKVRKQLPTISEGYQKLLVRAHANTDATKNIVYELMLSSLKEYVRDVWYTTQTMTFLTKEEYEGLSIRDGKKSYWSASMSEYEPAEHIHGLRNYFDGQSTITVNKDLPFVNIDISQLNDKEKVVARQIGIDFLTENFIKKNSESVSSADKLMAIFDEAHENFLYEFARISISDSVRTGAKRHVGIIISTQTVKEYTAYPETDAILSQAAVKMIFKQDYKDRDFLLKTLPITESQADIIVNEIGGNDTGSSSSAEKSKHKGEMCVIEDKKVCFVKVDYLKSAERYIVETNPDELEDILTNPGA